MNDFLSGYNFSRQSDVIFSEVISENGNPKLYIADYFELDSGNIIFSKTDYVLDLFNILTQEKDIIDLKLITHESDYEIDEFLFKHKPKCISKWYSTNVNYKHKDLVPIPIGLANNYCKITLKYENLIKQGSPKKLLYINHRNSTSPRFRSWIYDKFCTNHWCTVDLPNLSLIEYKKQLDNHKFIICPRGNGIDTHRLWESLYHGIIPIVEKQLHYECLKNLPVLLVNSFEEVTENFLIEKENELVNKKFNLDKLKVSWWINGIKNNHI